MSPSRLRRSPGLACVVGGVLAFDALAQDASTQSTLETVRVRVVERGTRKPVAGALVERFESEITICDSWQYRIVGDDLLPRKEANDAKKRREPDVPGTASTWVTEGSTGHATADVNGVALLEGSFEGGATLVASTPTLRGACVVYVKEDGEPPASAEIEVGPPRSVEVLVVGVDEKPRAGIPVEFGRFLDGARPREQGDDVNHDDRCEIWDRLGERVLTDEKGLAKLVDLELHGADDLEVLRGAKASPFCARAVVIGPSRIIAVVDPDTPPSSPVRLVIPTVGSIDLSVEFPDHQRIDAAGDISIGPDRATLAPGFQRVFDVEHGRARLFPVEAGVEGTLLARSQMLEDGNLTATTIQLIAVGDRVFGSSALARVESSCEFPRADGGRVDATLSPPKTWFLVGMRLLDAEKHPVPDADIDATLVVAATKSESGPLEATPWPHRHKCPRAKSAADGRVAILMRRPLVTAPSWIDVNAKSKSPQRSYDGRAERPLVFGDDRWRIDLGDVVLDR